jgi:RNA polymerase sigma factor (sigma-70 family)
MNALLDNVVDASTLTLPPDVGVAAQKRSASDFPRRRSAQTGLRFAKWRRRSQKWRRLMVAAQRGEIRAYEQLLREVEAWLRRYYARRLPPTAAEDARQDALLAIHAKLYSYVSSKPFGPWVAAIARYKWIDQIRDAARFAALSLDGDIPSEDEAATSALLVDDPLKQLKPAQACVIRLVKLQDLSIEAASRATGQSAALVKVNIHRGLKKLVALAADGAITPTATGNSSERRSLPSNSSRSNGICAHPPRNLAATNEKAWDGEEPRIKGTVGVNP